MSSLQVREDEVHNVPVDAAEKALQLHGHREANWVNALTVISKKEWMKRKEKYKKEASSHVPPKVQSSPPFLVARRLKEGIEPKEPILREQAAAALYNALRTTGVLKY